MENKVLGRIGEDAAVALLEAEGYRILARNYRCREGEIDIVAAKKAEISFIEVKTRRNLHYGRPCEAITEEKKNRIRKTGLRYLRKMREAGYNGGRISFGVIEILVEHTENAF